MTENTLPEAVTFTVECGPLERFLFRSDTRTFTIPILRLASVAAAAKYFPCSETENETEEQKMQREIRLIAAGVTRPTLLFGMLSLPYITTIPKIETIACYLHGKLKHDTEKISKLALIVLQMCSLPDLMASFTVLHINNPINE